MIAKSIRRIIDTESWIKLIKTIASSALIPRDAFKTNEGLTERNIEAMLARSSTADFLLYRACYKYKDEIDIYEMADGRKGIIFQIFPSPYLGESSESELRALFSSIMTDDTVMHIVSFASRNIDDILMKYRDIHSCDVNVRHPEVLKEMIAWRIKYLRKWSQESMVSGRDFRVRNFVNLISLSYPTGMSDEQIYSQFHQIKGAIKNLGAKNFPPEKLIQIVQEILNPDLGSWDAFFDQHQELNVQMSPAGTRMLVDRENRTFHLGSTGWQGATFTTKKFPKSLTLNQMQRLFFHPLGQPQNTLPCPFMISLVIHFDDIDKRAKKVIDKCKSDYKELSKAPKVMKDTNLQVQSRLEEAKDVIAYIEELSEVPLEAMWSMTLFENDVGRLNEYISTVKKEFRLQQWIIDTETFAGIGAQSMLWSLPLQYHHIVKKHLRRFSILFKSNNAAISPVIGEHRGWGDPINLFIGRTGGLIAWDAYSAENYNQVGVGGSGAGKSYSEGDNQLNLLAAEYRIAVIDIGESYKMISELVGGQYIEFTENSNMCLNFFSKIKDKELLDPVSKAPVIGPDGQNVMIVHEDEMNMIVPLVGFMVKQNLRASSSDDAHNNNMLAYLSAVIEQAINMAYIGRGREAGMKEVLDALIDIEREERADGRNTDHLHQMIESLYSWANPKGKFFSYFNGENNIDLNSDYTVLELDGLKEKGDLFYVAIMAIAQRISADFYANRSRRKYFCGDEAWRYVKIPLVAAFFEEFYRTIRKYNGSVKLISQSIADFTETPQLQAIFDNAAWQWLLKQKANRIDDAINSKKISLTDFEASIMKSVSPDFPYWGELLIKQEDGFFVTRIKLDPYSHWCCGSTRAADRMKIENIAKKYSITNGDAIWILARKTEVGSEVTEDDLVKELLAKKSINQDKKADEYV